MYVNCHSYFSLRYGTLSPKDILDLAEQYSLTRFGSPIHLCLTDINNVSGIPDFFREAQKRKGIHPCAGIDFRNGAKCLYVGIAKNEDGFAEINRFLSDHQLTKTPLPQYAPAFENAYIIYPFEVVIGSDFKKTLDEQEYIGIRPEQLGKLRLAGKKLNTGKCIALQSATFYRPQDFNTHKLLRAIENNCLLSKLPPNELGNTQHKYYSPKQIETLFKEVPELLRRTIGLLEQCNFNIEFGVNRNKKTFTGSDDEDFRLMSELAFEGLKYRYPKYDWKVKKRMEDEMKLIYELGFTSYFLISWDICRFAREKQFYYVGRGSGANSLVAYCLRITDVDPIDLNLFFERFINPYRTSPPDFDLDFSWKDRDEVTEYIFQKHGKEHTALIATYSTFQRNAVIRELGKVFGLPKNEIDEMTEKSAYTQMVTSMGNNDAGTQQNQLNIDTIKQTIIKYSAFIHDMPNYRSIHAGGIIISEKPIYYYTALDLPPKGFPTVQWSMLEAEDLGLAKLDILSQRGLGHIKEAIEIVKENRGVDVDIHRIQDFKNDDRLNQLLSNGRAMGCFYVESPAMRQLLKKLNCSDYHTLVAASSIIRPGVSSSGMMREYIWRHLDVEQRKTAHPVLHAIMPETYGVMVYQEDVIKVAHEFAGLGLAESDVLRRGMSGKYRSREEFQRVKEKFFALSLSKGHPPELAQEVWRQIESFAGYSFAKGHSASYAVESYQSLHLKAYFPLEFYVAVINNFGGFYSTEFYVHAVRMSGAQLELPCLNNSEFKTWITGKTVYLGFTHLRSIEQNFIERLIAERNTNGHYADLQDVIDRISPPVEQMKILIQIGALRFTGKNRKELMWECLRLLNKRKPVPVTSRLFIERPKEYKLPPLECDPLEDAFIQLELLGFTLGDPFLLADYSKDIKPSPFLAKHIGNCIGKRICIDGNLVTIKPTRTIKGQEMSFGTWIDRTGQFFDTVHFPQVLHDYPFRGKGVYQIKGVVTEDFGVYSIDAIAMLKVSVVPDPSQV